MEAVFNILIDLLYKELNGLHLGHLPDKKRIKTMRNLICLIMYLKIADLDQSEVKKILQIYSHI